MLRHKLVVLLIRYVVPSPSGRGDKMCPLYVLCRNRVQNVPFLSMVFWFGLLIR